MASHTVEDSVYGGQFLDVLQAYRSNDTSFIDICENQVTLSQLCSQADVRTSGSCVMNVAAYYQKCWLLEAIDRSISSLKTCRIVSRARENPVKWRVVQTSGD